MCDVLGATRKKNDTQFKRCAPPYEMDVLQPYIGENPVVVFGRPGCHECNRLETWMNANKTVFVKVDVAALDDEDVDVVVPALKSVSNRSQYPFCFYEGVSLTSDELRTTITMRPDDDF